MEAPPEDKLDSLKTSDSDISDSTITSSLLISPKKPIQLGVVQSSTGSRPSLGNLSLMKKSRWDQAPGSGENEEEQKETNIEPHQSEECNVKNLIQKFEDISGSSKSDSEKSNESSTSKPGRVKLVRTNFTKPEKPIVKIIDKEKFDETSKIEEDDIKSIIQPSEVLVPEVISVSSSKALQIISSNYDSHSDESSQEADNMPSNSTQDKPLLDSAYSSLERLSEGNNSEEKETIEEKLKSSHSLKSESEQLSGGSNIENKNSGVMSDCETKEIKKDSNIEENNGSEVISFDTVDLEMNPDDSQLKYQRCKINEVISKESTTHETNATITEQQEKENGSFHGKENPALLSCTQEITETPNIFNPSTSSGSKTEGEQNTVKTIELESVEASDNTKIDKNKQITATEINTVQEQLGAIELESGDAPDNSLINKKIDENKKLTITEINNVQTQLGAIKLERDSDFENKCEITNSDTLEQNPTKIGGSLEEVIIEENDEINSDPLSEEKENDIKIDDNLEKSSTEVELSETANEDDDFVIVTHADIEGYKLNNESVSKTECIAIAETGNLSDIETNTTVNACDNNVKDNLTAELSVTKNTVTEGIVEDCENSKIAQEADQLKQQSNIETNITSNACGNSLEDEFTAEISVMKNSVTEGNVEDVENSKVAQEAEQIDLQSDIETNVIVNACGNNVEDTVGADISEVKTTVTESNLEDGKNSKVVQEAEQRAGYSDNKTTQEKTVTEIIKTLDTEDVNIHALDNTLTFEKEKHKESINESKPICVETSSENTSQMYNDGVDAKMEQIFSENLGTVNEEPCSFKSNVEEDLISVTDMLKEENNVLEEPVCSNVSSEKEESENKLETNDSLLKILESEGSPEVFVHPKDNNGFRVNVEANKSDKEIDKCSTEETEFTNSDDFNDNMDSCAQIVAAEQNNAKPEESSLVKRDKDIALTEKVSLEIMNIEEVVSKEACTKEELVLQREIKNTFENPVNKDIIDVVDSKSGIALEIKDLKHESDSAHCHEAIAEGIGNSQIQNLSMESTSHSVGKQSSESEGLTENKVEEGASSNNEINTNIEAQIEGDEKNVLKNELINSKTAKESDILNEVKDVQLLNVVAEGNPQVVEAKFIVDETTVVEDESEGPQTDITFSEGDNVVVEEEERLVGLVESKITEMSDSSEKQESEILTAEEISILHTETENKSDEFNRGERMSNTVPAETMKVTSISEVPENSIPLRNLPNEIESEKLDELMSGSLISESLKDKVENDLLSGGENAEEKVVVAEEISDNSEKSLNFLIPQTADVEQGSNILISEFKNSKERDSNSTSDVIIDSPGCSVEKETGNKTKEILGVEDVTVSDSHCYSADIKQTTGKKEGSIEVSQQETIERSIDMLFEVPNSEQPLKSSTMPPASPSKDNMLEVSSEAKKLFSEEIEREMLKLSPEHEAQGEEETTDLPETNRQSPSVKKFDKKTLDTSESNVNILTDSCESSKDSTINNEENIVKLPFNLEGEKETLPSDDSDIATIQEIDSFLEGSNMQESKSFSDSNSKYENLPIEIDDESDKKITSKDEESDNFASCRAINEKTSAEDVLLGVEGDLDLDSSSTYDNKKLGLSPSSQPSISEDNYDLPGESYDKESLEKERETTALLSGVLEDVEKKSSQSDPELPVSKCNKSEDTVSEEVLRDEICDVAEVPKKDSLKENNQSGAKADVELSQSKTQTTDFTSENEIKRNKDKIEEELTIIEESKVEESHLLHETDVETLEISTKNDSETLPNSSLNICDKKEEVYIENPTKIDIEPSSTELSDSNVHDRSIASKEVTVLKDYEGKSRDGDVEGPKGNLSEVIDDVCDVPAYVCKHEEEVKGSTKEKGNEKCEVELKLGNKEVSNKPDATSNKIEPQKSKCKDVDVDFENLIPHMTVSSKINEDLKIILSKADKSEIGEGSHEKLNVLKEDKREQSILVNPNGSVGMKTLPISEDKEEPLLEKSECPSSENPLEIHSDEGKVPLADIPNNESNNKTSKRPCPSMEEVTDNVSVDQDNTSSDTGPKRIKKTKTSDVESEVEPYKAPTARKNVPAIKDSSVPPSQVSLNQTPIKSQPVKAKTKNVSHEEKKSIPHDDASLDQANSATPVKSESSEEESISLDLSPNQSSGATSAKSSEKIITPKISSSVVKKSSPQKSTLNKIPSESKAIEDDTKIASSEEKKINTLPASSLDQASSVISVESESFKEYSYTKTDSSLEEKSISTEDSLNQESKPLIDVAESKPGKDSISANINLEAEVNQARAHTSSVNSEPSIKLISTDVSDDKKSIHNIDSLNQAPKSVPTPCMVLAESSKENSTTKSGLGVEVKSVTAVDSANQAPVDAISTSEQAGKASKSPIVKEVPAPVRVSARQKQRQAAAAAALAAKEKAEAVKSPGQSAPKKSAQEKQGDKRGKKSLSPTKELHIKTSGKSLESGKQSPLDSQKSPKNVEAKVNLQVSPKKVAKEVGQDKLEPITLKLSKEENPVIVRSSSLSPKKNVSPHSPQGKTLGYTLKIGKDSTTIIPKDSTSSPTRRESSPGTSSAKSDLTDKVSYLIKDTGLTITPVAPPETQEQKLNKITLKLSKAGGHPEIKQENKSETWKAIRKLGEIDIVPVESKTPTEIKRKDKIDEGSPEKKLKLGDVTVEPSTSSGVSKLQGLLTQAPLNQSDSSEDGKFIGFGSPTEKLSPAQQQASYDIGMIRHDDSPQPPRKRGRPRKITSPDEIVHSVSVPHSLPPGLTAKDILAASLQHQSLQQHLHSSYQPPQSFQAPEEVDSSQPMVPLFDLFEVMDPSPPTIFPDQVQPSTDIIMRSARGRPIGRSRRPRGSGLVRGHERGGPRGRPRGSRGIKRILEEMEAMSFPDPDQPITLENIDAEMGPRIPEHAASELTMALLRKSIEGKKEILEKKARRSDGSEEGNSDLEAKVREMKEKIEEAYQAQLKSPGKEAKKRTPEKPEMKELTKKSPPGLIPLQKLDENARRKSADGKELVKRKLSEDKTEDGPYQLLKRRSTDENPECSTEESAKEVSEMEIDQTAPTSEDPSNQEEIKTEPEPPPKPVKPRPKSKAEIKRIKREKDRLRREAKKLAALEALKAPPPNPCEEDTRMSASDPNGEGIDGEGSGIKKNRMEVGDPEGKEFTVEQIAEYQWPLQGGELYMIQEQISTWLGVKSFQRKYPDLKRRRVEMEERTYLCDSGLVAESMCDLGLTAVSSSEVLDIMFQDFPEQYEELRKHMREKQARELINKQKERKKFEQTLSKSDLKEHAIQSLVSWNANLNKNRNETRKCHLDLQTWTIQYPRNKAAKMTRPTGKLGSYPVALIPGQYADYYKRYTPQELRYFPVNTVLYGPLQPNEMHSTAGGSDGSQSESEDTSSSDGSSDSSSEGEGDGTEEEDKERERECKTCGSKKGNEAMLQCSQCSHNNSTVTVWA